MKTSLWTGARIKKQLKDNPDSVVVTSSLELQMELAAHDIPAELLFCVPDNQILVLPRDKYIDLKHQEEALIHGIDNPGESSPQ